MFGRFLLSYLLCPAGLLSLRVITGDEGVAAAVVVGEG